MQIQNLTFDELMKLILEAFQINDTQKYMFYTHCTRGNNQTVIPKTKNKL
jgi:protein tyrosine/serine phosphatase